MTFDQMIQTASSQGASDIHLRAGHVPLVRVDGTLERWTNVAGISAQSLEAIASHVFTTRAVPLSSADDWRLVARAIGADRIVTPHQVHGREVRVIRRGSPPPVERPACDALVSDGPETAVAIRAADCVPVLLVDARTGAVAAVHAGWRGVAAGTIGTAVDALTASVAG